MKRIFTSSGLALVFMLGIATWAPAQEVTFNLDPEKTTISFALGATFHTVHGTFRVKGGAIRFDPSTGVASGGVVVDATSGQTGNKKRDRTMHRDVLQSQRYPEITFTPTRVTGNVPQQGQSRVQVEGIIRLQDSDHPVTLPLQVQANGNELRASTLFIIPYVAWGLKNPSNIFLHVADKVELTVVATGKLTPAQR
jgi:polyisoprenoid-binding protein YceI